MIEETAWPICQCDVSDRDRLRDYRTKRSEWLHIMNGDPDHAVWRQIRTMLWSYAVFRTINEARRLAHASGRASAALNGTLIQFIDQGFVATQTLSIRKLMDRPSAKPDQQVISVRRLLDEIQGNLSLFTRENYVCEDGLPYDPELAEQRFMERVATKITEGLSCDWHSTHRPDDFHAAKMAHQSFDLLSGKLPGERQRSDVVRVEVLDKLNAILDASGWEHFKKFSNKFIAHAADEQSRSGLSANAVSLDQLTRCHEALCRVAGAIQNLIFGQGSRDIFATAQFDRFNQLDAVWTRGEDQARLRSFWNDHVKKVESWTSIDPAAWH